MSEPIRVLIADDHPLFRDGLAALLRSGQDTELAGAATTGPEAIELAGRVLPDVVMMDLRLPGLNGIEATRRIVAASPHVAVVVLTMLDDDSVFAALRAGARGYLLKGADHEEIRRAVHAAAAGEAIFGTGLAARVLAYFAAHHAEPAIYACLGLAVLPLLAFFHAVRCKRALLCPATAMPVWARAHEATWLGADWDVYELESDAFDAAGAARPREWESRRAILLLVRAVYGVAAVMLPVLLATGLPWSTWINVYVAVAIVVIPAAAALYPLARWRRRRAGRRRLRAQSGVRDGTRRSPEDQNQIPVCRTDRA